MKITFPTVAPHIADYVQGILIIENHEVSTPFTLPLFANGTPTLLFQTAKGSVGDQSNHLTLFGQTVSPKALTITESFDLIAYFLKPHSLTSLFGLPAHTLTDTPIDLNAIPAGKMHLQEHLLNAPSVLAMLSLLDSFIFGLIQQVKTSEKAIQYAAGKIAGNPAKDALLDIRRELCMTERTFQRNFGKIIGVTPNQFRRIAQFNKAFQQLGRARFHHLTDIALDNGYFDQSHYIMAFKEFTGLTPTEYLRLTAGLVD